MKHELNDGLGRATQVTIIMRVS